MIPKDSSVIRMSVSSFRIVYIRMIPKGQNGYIESKNKNYIYRIGLCKQELLGAVNKKYEEEL